MSDLYSDDGLTSFGIFEYAQLYYMPEKNINSASWVFCNYTFVSNEISQKVYRVPADP